MPAPPSSRAPLGGAAVPVDDEALVRRCAAITARKRLHGITVDDALQVGRLAVWQARQEGRVPSDPLHAENYLHRRAIGAMLDLCRADRRWLGQGKTYTGPALLISTDGNDVSFDAADEAADPQATYAVRQAVEQLARRATPQQLACLDLLASGLDPYEVAHAMGRHPSRICQLTRDARRVLAELL